MESTLEADVVLADRYRLVEPIGRGGYSVVWIADHVVTGKRVALKVLTKRGDEPASRFLREARITARIDHPDVVNIHDLFQLDGSDALVMVMDLLEGVSLAERLRSTEGAAGISVAETAHIVLSVASALEAAHALGVVHRDLKPENVFLTNDGRVRVLDFGVAKWIHPEPEALLTPDLTETGAILGTPHYMAPEQVFGEPDVDGRADVWALGVIAYECLAGARPIDGENFGQVFKAIAMGEIVPLRTRASAISPAIGAFVDRMLARKREARPGLAEIRAAFQAAIEGSDGTPAPTPDATPPVPRGSARRVLLMLAVVLLAAASLGAVQIARTRSGAPRAASVETPTPATRTAATAPPPVDEVPDAFATASAAPVTPDASATGAAAEPRARANDAIAPRGAGGPAGAAGVAGAAGAGPPTIPGTAPPLPGRVHGGAPY